MPKRKILVVDDEPEIVKSISMRLEKQGYEVFTASDGYDATKTAMQEIPDLIILDIGMPMVSGHEVVRCLRASDQTKEIPVIYLTAYSTTENYKQAVDEGVDTFIAKPFKVDQVMSAIEDLLCKNTRKI